MLSNAHPIRPSSVILVPPYVIKEKYRPQGVHPIVLPNTKAAENVPTVSPSAAKETASAVTKEQKSPIIPQQRKLENEDQRRDGLKMGKMLISRRKDATISISDEENSEEDKGNISYLYIVDEGDRKRFQIPQLTRTGFLDTSETQEAVASSGTTFNSKINNSDAAERPTEMSSRHTPQHQRPPFFYKDVLTVQRAQETSHNSFGRAPESFSPVTTYKPESHIQLKNNNNNNMNNNNKNNNNNNSNNNNNNNSRGAGPKLIDHPLIKPEIKEPIPAKAKAPPQIQNRSGIGVDFQEELADFSNLFHHQKTVDELAKSDKEVAVREEEWLMTKEGSTAVILVGMCSVIMMLICFIFLLKKWRKETSGKGGKKEHSHHDKDHHHKSVLGDLHVPTVSVVPQLRFIHSLAQLAGIENLSLQHDENDFDETVLGRIWFTVVYDDEKSDLRVNIMHARYPSGRGVGSNTGEVWIEGIIISPMNTVKGTSRTSTRRATYSPVFNHNFLYMIAKDEVKTCILKLTLHDRHPKKGERQVGSIILPLSSVNLSSKEILCRDLL